MTMKSTHGRPQTRMKRKTLFMIASLATSAAYIALTVFARDQQWLIWPALTCALLSVVFAAFWMAALDEAAQQAHYIAWFWGGNVGMMLSMVAFVTVALRPDLLNESLSALSPAQTLAFGIAIGLVPAVVGYAIWWAILWLRRG